MVEGGGMLLPPPSDQPSALLKGDSMQKAENEIKFLWELWCHQTNPGKNPCPMPSREIFSRLNDDDKELVSISIRRH